MNKISVNNQIYKKGFSVVEVIIYLSLLIIVSVLIIDNLISLFKNYNIVRANQNIEYNAINILDKMNRDIVNAKSVSIDQSSFIIPQGVLVLNNSSTSTIKFSLENDKLKYYKDNNFIANLSTRDVIVNNFKIYFIQATSSSAIRVDLGLSIKPHLSGQIINKNFHNTIQLRQ